MRARAASSSRRSRPHSGHSEVGDESEDDMDEKDTPPNDRGKGLVGWYGKIDAVTGLNGYPGFFFKTGFLRE